MSHSTGTKVTSDPERLRNPKNENPGTVASDSLAAESIQGGGSFAANSDARGVSGAPAGSTTTNTVDTSNATELEPAPARPLRNDDPAQDDVLGGGNGPTYSNVGSGSQAAQLSSDSNSSGASRSGYSGNDGASGSGSGYGGQSGSSGIGGQSGGSSGHSGSGSGSGSGSSTSSAYGNQSTSSGTGNGGHSNATGGSSGSGYSGSDSADVGGKPHGKNITEGGFSTDAPNASLGPNEKFDHNIGDKKDPAREALSRMEERDVPSTGGAGPRQTGLDTEGQFDELKETSA